MKTLLIAAVAFLTGTLAHFALHSEPKPQRSCQAEVEIALVKYRMADIERRVREHANVIQVITNEANHQQMRVNQITNQ